MLYFQLQMTNTPSKSDSAKPSHLARSPAFLEVEGAGKFPIEHVATIGRAPESDVVLNKSSVSRHQARIFYEGGRFWIKDLDSANGTFVNGKKIKLQMLGDQDKILFGEARAVFITGSKRSGPALVAQDPLEGSDTPSDDGTPTGGLKSSLPGRNARETWRRDAEASPEKRRHVADTETEIIRLSDKIASLQAENERLRRLVARLERALADANLRLRNMQERLEHSDP